MHAQEVVVDDVVLAMNGRTVLCSNYGSVSALPPPGQEPAPMVAPNPSSSPLDGACKAGPANPACP